MIKHYESEGTSTNFQQMRVLCCELGLPEGQKRVRTIPGQGVFLMPYLGGSAMAYIVISLAGGNH
jgi:hypothetical protein